jgi:hypothetical protein
MTILAYYCNLEYWANNRLKPFKIYIHPECVITYEIPRDTLDGAIADDPNGHTECDFCHEPLRRA